MLRRFFFSSFSGFPSSTKTNATEIQFDVDFDRLNHEALVRETEQPLPTLLDVKWNIYLFK